MRSNFPAMGPAALPLSARRSGPLAGVIRPPGDKSISHRALMLGTLAVGETAIEGLLEGDDVLATAAAMRAFGATVTRKDAGSWRVRVTEGGRSPAKTSSAPPTSSSCTATA